MYFVTKLLHLNTVHRYIVSISVNRLYPLLLHLKHSLNTFSIQGYPSQSKGLQSWISTHCINVFSVIVLRSIDNKFITKDEVIHLSQCMDNIFVFIVLMDRAPSFKCSKYSQYISFIMLCCCHLC